MPSNILATLNQISQIGVEATPGTSVAATRRLQSLGLPMSPSKNIQEFKPRGAKFSTAHVETQDWSEGEIDDDSGLAYNEIQYVLESVFSKATPTTIDTPVMARSTAYALGAKASTGGFVYEATVAGTTSATAPTFNTTLGSTTPDGTVTWTNRGTDAGNAFRRVYDIATYQRDNVQTYTIETGDRQTGRSYRAPYCFFTGLEIESGRADEISVSGDIVGHARESFPLTTSGIQETDLIPATPAHLNVYMDNSHTALGSTLLDGNITSTLSLTDRATQTWFHGRNYKGPSGRVEQAPDATFELVQADGEEVDEMVETLRSGQRKFFRFEFVGPEVVAGVRNSLVWDICGKIGDAPGFDDEDGVYAATLPFVAEHDGAWGRAMRVTLVNGMATL